MLTIVSVDSGPGFTRAGASLVPVTDVIEEIVVVRPSQVEVYNVVDNAAAGLDCSVNADGSANCVARASGGGQLVTQTVNNIPGAPTTIYAQPTSLATPLQLPALGSGAAHAVGLASGILAAGVAIAVIAIS